MACLLNKIAQVLLILFCSRHTRIDCAESETNYAKRGFFAIIKASNPSTESGPSSCGGVWTTLSFILTAASCLDEDGKLGWKVNGTIDVLVWQMVRTKDNTYYWNQEKDGTFKGKAIFHPKYRRVDGPTVYDLAYVKAFGKRFNHKTISICKEFHPSNMIAIGRTSNNLTFWNLQQTTDRNIAIVNNLTDGKGLSNLAIQGREYKIDPSKQFTARLNISDQRKKEGTTGPFNETIFSKEGLGGPILYKNRTNICLGGIMTSKGVKGNEMYLTATKSYPFRELTTFFEEAKKHLYAAEKGNK